jgi:hypothetical protein
MFFDGFLADEQHFADLGAGVFLGDQLQDLLFARRQVGERITLCSGDAG